MSFFPVRIFLTAALLAGCARDAEPPPMRLVGYRALVREGEAVVPVFDAERRPVIQVRGAVDGGTLVWLAGDGARPASARVQAVEGGALWRVDGDPPGVGPVTLRWTAGGRERRWAARWEATPEAALAEAVALRKAGREADARARLDAVPAGTPAARWVPAERARLAGGPDAWVDAAAASPDSTEAGRCLRVAAFHALQARRFDEAGALLDRAAAADERFDDVVGAARTRYYRGLLAFDLGDFRRALEALGDAARRSRALGEDVGARNALEALALAHLELGRHGDALSTFEALRPAALVDPDPERRVRFRLNEGYARLRAMAEGALPPAWDAPRAVLAEAVAEARAHGLGEVERYALANLAWNELLRGDRDGARRLLDEARAREPRGSPGPVRLFLDLLDAEILLRDGHLDGAEARFAAVAEAARAEVGPVSEAAWRARYGEGRAAAAAGRAERAVAAFRAAMDALDALGRSAPLRSGRAPFFADRRPLYDDALALLLSLGRASEAFAVGDAARARLVRALEAEVRVERLATPAQRATWAARLAAFGAARDAHAQAVAAAGPAAGEHRAARDAALAALAAERTRAFDAALAFLDEADRDGASPAPTGDAVAAALAPDEALLAVTPHRGGHVLFRVAAGRVEHAPLGPAALEGVAAGRGEHAPLGPGLLDGLPEGVRHVYVIAGGRRDALDLPARLAERASVAFLPHAGFLVRPRGERPAAALVVADPEADLPGARADGRDIAARLGARLLLGDAATRRALVEALPGAGLVHFAGHGVLRETDPWGAHLRLAGGEPLDLADVLTLRLARPLVVLGGCRTGVPMLDDGVGLPQAFLAAGAAAVVAADRVVSDDDARAFSTRFFAADGARRPAEALRLAMRSMRAEGRAAWDAWRLFGLR